MWVVCEEVKQKHSTRSAQVHREWNRIIKTIEPPITVTDPTPREIAGDLFHKLDKSVSMVSGTSPTAAGYTRGGVHV